MNGTSIGLLELTSVAAGYAAADAMLKAGEVRLLLSRSICSGKFMVLIGGEPSAVAASLDAGARASSGCVIEQVHLTQLHPEVLEAVGRCGWAPPGGALGVVESFSVASLVAAADAAMKAASITLLELRLAMALGGKAVALFTGDTASVQGGVAAAERVLVESGTLVHSVVLPRPHPDLYRELV